MSMVRIAVMVIGKGVLHVEMPADTSCGRAADLVGEKAGADLSKWEGTLKVVGGSLLDSETPIAEYAGKDLLLLQKRRAANA